MRKVTLLALGLAMAAGLAVRAAEKPSEAHVKVMKDIGAAVGGLRGNVTAKNYDAIAKDATTLKGLLTTVETVWTARKADDAIASAKAGVKAAGDLETAAK